MKRLFYILLCGFIFFITCKKEEETNYAYRTSYFKNISTGYNADSVLKCVTFNIHLGFKSSEDPWNKDQQSADMQQIENIANILRQLDADIIALQEVPRNRYNALIKNFIEELSAELNMNYAFGAHGYNDPQSIVPVKGEWGNAILSKFEITGIQNEEVEFRSIWEKRSILDTKLKLNDSTFLHAISLHHLPSEEAILNTTSHLKKLNGKIIVMGDFNHMGNIYSFNEIGLYDADTTAFGGIDRIFVTEKYFDVLQNGILKDTLQTSDHPAVYTVLRIKK